MPKDKDYRLCGGTFFVLLSDARKPLLNKNENYMGKKSGITEVELLLALTKIVVPDIPKPMSSELKTLRDNTRDFKSCENWGGGFLRLGDKSVQKSFDERVKSNYFESLTAMSKLVDKYIDAGTSTKKDEYLVKALVEVIINDKEILDDQLLYICTNGKPITKSELRSITDICLHSFLLGIWHFVLTAVENNTVGKDTYNKWCPPHGDNKGSKREYVVAIGENSKRSVTVNYNMPDNDTDMSESSYDTDDEYIEEKSYSEECPPPVSQATVNNNPVFMNFNISGNGNHFYQNVENLTINNGVIKKDE